MLRINPKELYCDESDNLGTHNQHYNENAIEVSLQTSVNLVVPMDARSLFFAYIPCLFNDKHITRHTVQENEEGRACKDFFLYICTL